MGARGQPGAAWLAIALGWEPRGGEMPTDIPASDGCLRNSQSWCSSAGDPKRLPSLLTPLASSAGAGGSGPARAIVASLRERVKQKEEEKTVMATPRLQAVPGKKQEESPGSAEEDEAGRGLGQRPPAPRSSRGAEQRSGWQQDDGDGGGTPAPSTIHPCPGREGSSSSTTRTKGSPTGKDEAGKGTAR